MSPSYDLRPTWVSNTPAPSAARRLNFGHDAPANRLFKPDATGWPVWTDGGTRLSPDQFAAMSSAQRAEVLARVPAGQREAIARGLAGGHARRARIEGPSPGDAWTPSANTQLQARVRDAARLSTGNNLGVSAACYDTANQGAKLAGGRDLDSGARDVLAARSRPLSHLRISAEAGSLKVGMAVYMNLAPGSNPRSVNDETCPHWATYLGKDEKGVMRFSDQYRADWSLDELAGAYAPRRIDLFADPFAGQR